MRQLQRPHNVEQMLQSTCKKQWEILIDFAFANNFAYEFEIFHIKELFRYASITKKS